VLTLFATHGSGGGGRPGSKVNRVEDLSKAIDADVYLHAHNHILSVVPSIRLGVAGSNLVERKVLYVNTGTLLKSWKEGSTSYAERKSMLPSKIGVAKIRVEPYRMDLHASI
jgi:hypothetical protein